LIAHSPRSSSVTPEKAVALPGMIAGLRLALFERGRLEREVDILFYLVRRLPQATLPVGRRYPLAISVQDLASWFPF
jgi:hypothetical protein